MSAGAFRDLAYAKGTPPRPKPWSLQNKFSCDGGKLLLSRSDLAPSRQPAQREPSILIFFSFSRQIGKEKPQTTESKEAKSHYSLNPQSNSARHMKALNVAVWRKE
jgi:hypothetical protein